MPNTQHAERRQYERTAVEKSVILLVESDNRNMYHDALTVDLSPQGARVRGQIGLTPGQSIDLITKGSTPQVVLSQVVWVNRTGSDQVGEAGLQFLEPAQLPYALLSAHSAVA